eukprot:s2291_g5.t1
MTGWRASGSTAFSGTGWYGGSSHSHLYGRGQVEKCGDFRTMSQVQVPPGFEASCRQAVCSDAGATSLDPAEELKGGVDKAGQRSMLKSM